MLFAPLALNLKTIFLLLCGRAKCFLTPMVPAQIATQESKNARAIEVSWMRLATELSWSSSKNYINNHDFCITMVTIWYRVWCFQNCKTQCYKKFASNLSFSPPTLNLKAISLLAYGKNCFFTPSLPTKISIQENKNAREIETS